MGVLRFCVLPINKGHMILQRINTLMERRCLIASHLEEICGPMSPVRREHVALRLPIWAAVFVTLICVAIFAMSGWREWSSRDVELKNTEIDMANLAQSLAQHAADTFELVDMVLNGVVHRLELDGNGPEAITRLQTFIDLRRPNLGRIRGLFVYDESGRWLVTTELVNLNGLNNSDREYFRRHAQSDDRGLLIGRPVKSRSGGQWIITASKRFNHPNGTFAGVVLATIDVAYFVQFFDRFDVGKKGAVSLLSADGIMLARSPDDGTYVGRDLSSTPFFKNCAARPASGAYYFTSPLDGSSTAQFLQDERSFSPSDPGYQSPG